MSVRFPRFIGSCALAVLVVTSLCDSALAKAVTPDFVELAKKLTPTVVNISTSKTVTPQRYFRRPTPGPFGTDPFEDFFQHFFEMPRHPLKEKSLGSGFIISDEGYIITNFHVVAGADDIKVKLSDGREFKGELKGRDEKLDLALVKIDAKDHLPVAKMGDSDSLEIGEWVTAIGNPFGLSQTVTAGIISAKGRVIGTGPYDDFVQTDASINPGNSGGPLFNSSGEVIGINTAIVAGGQGIGFAIPVNMAKSVLPQLRESGRVTRGWLGVSIQPVTQELAKSFGLQEEKGALVAEVMKESPAEKAGIKSGDIILEYNGKQLNESTDLPRLVAMTSVGAKIDLIIFRNGTRETKSATIAKLAETGEEGQSGQTQEKLGITVSELTRELSSKLGIKETSGVVVTGVKPGGPAESAGIQQGDVILEVNSTSVKSIAEYDKTVAGLKKNAVVRLLIKRGDALLYVAMRVE
jgi:serine protease Do